MSSTNPSTYSFSMISYRYFSTNRDVQFPYSGLISQARVSVAERIFFFGVKMSGFSGEKALYSSGRRTMSVPGVVTSSPLSASRIIISAVYL